MYNTYIVLGVFLLSSFFYLVNRNYVAIVISYKFILPCIGDVALVNAMK